jgi:Major tropism determinant N-terminal domain
MGNSLIQLRRGKAAFWTDANPILHLGEPGYETDTRKLKVGDGVTHWRELPYFEGEAGGGGGGGGDGGGSDDDIPDLVLFYENGKV